MARPRRVKVWRKDPEGAWELVRAANTNLEWTLPALGLPTPVHDEIQSGVSAGLGGGKVEAAGGAYSWSAE